ncbi:hypothetical protein [Paenibacillus sp. Cedars]|uniref:hypothetical protein n=1 Tax=Paenibacillus sp. Cedars TaxID=1980674 RepID=UPI00116386C6|nr:hypothetical protein [Paenibacillus sp. Cedars]AWP25419.1 hypothetical protein B9D94_01635 [Paenibacillus sp. Cedars]
MRITLKTMLLIFVVLLLISTTSFAKERLNRPSAVEYYNKLNKKIFSDFDNADINVKEYVQIKDLVGVASKLNETDRRLYERNFKVFVERKFQERDQYVYVFISTKKDSKYKNNKHIIIDSETNKVLVEGKGWSSLK